MEALGHLWGSLLSYTAGLWGFLLLNQSGIVGFLGFVLLVARLVHDVPRAFKAVRELIKK